MIGIMVCVGAMLVFAYTLGWWARGLLRAPDPRTCRHRYRPRYDEAKLTLEQLQTVNRQAEAMATTEIHTSGQTKLYITSHRDHWFKFMVDRLEPQKTYVHDVCERCGDVIDRNEEARRAKVAEVEIRTLLNGELEQGDA